jgi:biotin transport system substrate-specific component
MNTLALAVAPPRISDRPAYRIVAILAGSLFVAALAQVQIRLWFTPIPITGQMLGVLLVAATLGPELGAASLLLYLAEGAIGLPFFAGAASGWSLLALSSVYGGYLWGFVVAAGVVGALARRGWDRSLRGSISAMLLGEMALYALAIPWLAAAAGVSVQKALELGLYPFVLGDALKLLAAAGALPVAWRLVGRREG